MSNQALARTSPFLYRVSGHSEHVTKLALLLSAVINLLILFNYTYRMEFLAKEA